MKNRKSFLKGALCGALAMLLVAGLVSCGLKVNNGNSDITSKTERRTSEHRSMYSYVRLSIIDVQLRTSEHRSMYTTYV